jgi:hypothetical protein
MTRRPGAQRKRKCLLRAVKLFRVARVARVVCRRRMTRRLGAQRKGKCRLKVAGLLRSATVTRFLFSFCWPEKQGPYTSHAENAPEKQGAFTSTANSAQSLLRAKTALDNAAWPDILARSGRGSALPRDNATLSLLLGVFV